MLRELQKIHEAVESKPATLPAPAPTGFRAEFTVFLNEYGILGLAITFIIGGATGALVMALGSDARAFVRRPRHSANRQSS